METTENKIKTGDVVSDSYSRLGIVKSVDDERPSDEWMEGQESDRVRLTPEGDRWFTVFPLDGGAVNSPGSSTMYVRRPTIEDLRKSLRSPGGFTQEEMAEMFPEEMDEVLGNSKVCWWVLTLNHNSLHVEEDIQVLASSNEHARKIADQIISKKWSVKHAEPADSVVHP